MFLDCVGRVPVSLWGSGGWGCVSLDVAQPFATVPQPFATVRVMAIWAVPMVSSAEGVVFWRFHMWCCFVSCGRRGHFVDIQTCFVTCRKSFCVAGAIPLRRFQKMRLQFSRQAQHFGHVHPDVSCCVFFCESQWQGCVKWRQGADSVAGVAFCEICWKRFLRKPIGKRRFWSCNVSKLAEVSHEMLVFVSTRVSGFPVTSPCLWGKLQNLSFSKVFCWANTSEISVVILRGKHTPHTTFYPLHTPHFTLLTPPSTLYTPHSTLYPLHTPHSTLYTPHSSLHTLHTPHTPHTPHSTLSTLHFPLHTSHPTLYTPHTPHSTLLHSTLLTLHSTLHTLPFPLYTFHSTLHTLHFTHSTLPTPHFTLHTPYFTLRTPHSTLSTPHCRMVTGEICTRVFK